MKHNFFQKVNPTMVEQLVNFENYKTNALEQMTEFVNNSSIPNKEEAIEEYKQMLLNDEEEPKIVLGGEFQQYVLTYDEFSNNIFFGDENDDTFMFGVEVQFIYIDNYYTYADIAEELNYQIEEYLKDKILADCGAYWEVKV